MSEYAGDDFYCDLAIPRKVPVDVVHEDHLVLAFHHTRPYWSTHVVVVPKKHIPSLTAVTVDDESDLRALFAAVRQIAHWVETTEGSAAVLTNLGGYQDSKHLHIHVHAGARLR